METRNLNLFSHLKIKLFAKEVLFIREHVRANNFILEEQSVSQKFEGSNIFHLRKTLRWVEVYK